MSTTTTLKRLSINDSKELRKNNKRKHNMFFSRYAEKLEMLLPWERSYDSITLTGDGAQELHASIGAEGVNDLFATEISSTFIKERYELPDHATLQDLFDAAPTFSAIYIGFIQKPRGGTTKRRSICLIKEAGETDKNLGSGRVVVLHSEFEF